jgi:peptidoglycan/LPS O-acetylase OafA/YrhL
MTHHPLEPLRTSERYHSLDALRAVAMLLGIAIHAAISFIATPVPVWPAADRSRHIAFDLLTFALHGFRLQAFFLMAGFFAALLWERRGWKGFVLHRIWRIGLPLLLASATFLPLTQAVFVIGFNQRPGEPYINMNGQELDLRAYKTGLVEFFASGAFLTVFQWMHLWFLFYLLLIYAIAVAAAPIVPRLARALRIEPAFRVLLRSRAKAVLFAVPTFVVMLPMHTWQADTPSKVAPEWRIVIYYLLFFGCGWLLYRQRELIAECGRHWRTHLLLAIFVVLPLTLGGISFSPFARLGNDLPAMVYPTLACYSLFTWLMVFGSIGLFERYFSQPRPAMRYISDASYWMYLAHLPLVIGLQIVVANWPGGAFLKFCSINVVSAALLLASYQLFVRYTWIGALLNGRKKRPDKHALGRSSQPA